MGFFVHAGRSCGSSVTFLPSAKGKKEKKKRNEKIKSVAFRHLSPFVRPFLETMLNFCFDCEALEQFDSDVGNGRNNHI